MMRSRTKSASPRISQTRSLTAHTVALLKWYRTNKRDLPWRRTNDPYAIWISEAMLQQTQVETVIPYFLRWMQRVPDITALAGLAEEDGLTLWAGLGYYNRLRNLIRAARVICEEHGGRIPSETGQLLTLPGIGPYTAGAISSIAFNRPEPLVDGNVVRILCRFHGLAEAVNTAGMKEQLWKLARTWVEIAAALPERGHRNCSDLNQGLMELGACICVPREPLCGQCPLSNNCVAFEQGIQGELPRKVLKPRPKRRRLLVVMLTHRGLFWIEQREEPGHNRGFWQFPEIECDPEAAPAEVEKVIFRFCKTRGFENPVFVGRARHSITNNQYELLAFKSGPGISAPSNEGRWIAADGFESIPFSSAHRKVLRLLTRQAR